MKEGIVTPTGMIAHGRGEAFDYLLGERSTESAIKAEKEAAYRLMKAKNPVLCVNGNAAVVAGEELMRLAELLPAKVEVNLFHRNEDRMEKVISYVEGLGSVAVLGRSPDAFIEGIASERARCCHEGIASSDVILVPIEDGDRAKALVDMGKTVIAIDLNPLSRTSRTATVSIVDEASRAINNIIQIVRDFRNEGETIYPPQGFDNKANLMDAVAEISDSLVSNNKD